MHRLADLVDEDLHADPLIPEVRRRRPDPEWQALCWVCGLPALLEFQPAQGQKAWDGAGRVDGVHWAFAGGQVKSLLSLLSYLGKGENRERHLGVKIPSTNLQADDLEQARTFAAEIADRLAVNQAA